MNTMPTRSALKLDVFAHSARLAKLDALGDPLQLMARHIDFEPLVQSIDTLVPRGDGKKGGRPPYPTAVMVRILMVKCLNQHSDEQMEFLLLDRTSYQRLKGLGATHTKKHGKSYHGYKLSVSVDVKHKFIRNIVTGTASEHDSTHFDDVLDEGNTGANVYADRGYPSRRRSQMLAALGCRDHIPRKGQAGKPLSACQQGRNQRIARARARVEHVFAQMHHMGGKLIRTIGQARATVAMTIMSTCYNLKRLS